MREAVAITGAGAVTSRDVSTAALPEAVRARATRTERVTQLVLLAGGRALAAAGLEASDGAPRPRLGVVLGTAFGCFLTNAAYQRRLGEGGPAAASPRLFAATVSNAAAGELAIAYRLGGPLVTLTAGAASGLGAVGHAADLVRTGRADALVA
ncbi:MAG TPA: beta-ketoacyl synthase N-terminal-like domain-containing protein, partial [Candidatus Elarobacter sp.]|nr:beta-ketoacyl synthase N-terminal-like domain-containing protein [Candidatus Elarobacter sp.]